MCDRVWRGSRRRRGAVGIRIRIRMKSEEALSEMEDPSPSTLVSFAEDGRPEMGVRGKD